MFFAAIPQNPATYSFSVLQKGQCHLEFLSHTASCTSSPYLQLPERIWYAFHAMALCNQHSVNSSLAPVKGV